MKGGGAASVSADGLRCGGRVRAAIVRPSRVERDRRLHHKIFRGIFPAWPDEGASNVADGGDRNTAVMKP